MKMGSTADCVHRHLFSPDTRPIREAGCIPGENLVRCLSIRSANGSVIIWQCFRIILRFMMFYNALFTLSKIKQVRRLEWTESLF